MREIAWTSLRVPVLGGGSLAIAATKEGLFSVSFVRRAGSIDSVVERVAKAAGSWRRAPWRSAAFDRLEEAETELRAYFRGRLRRFGVSVDFAGRSTPFHRRVWRALREIPFGELSTYNRLAAEVGRPGAARAVGGAVGRNPIPIVLPCHRVVGADGALTGFSAGLPLKVRLLALEGWAISPGPLLRRCRPC
jgi:O-6-methylguanine DNA methyltransferase